MKSIINIVKKSPWFIILTVIFLLPNITLCIICFVEGEVYNFLRSLFYTLVTLNIYLVPLIITRNLRARAMLFIWSPYYLIIPFILIVIILFHKWPTKSLLYIIFSANNFELIEFMSGNWLVKVTIILYISFLTVIGLKKRGNIFGFNLKQRGYLVLSFIILFLLLGLYKSVRSHSVLLFSKNIGKKFIKETPVAFGIKLYKAGKKNYEIKYSESGVKENELIVKREQFGSKEIFVLVIGESSRYKNWGLNGYQYPTSPRLDTTPGIFHMNNAFSVSFVTEISVPAMLTVDAATGSLNKGTYSIIDYFNSGGFKTVWITNQPNLSGKVGGVANKADTIISLLCGKQHCYDEQLLHKLRSTVKSNEPKLFIVLHQMGSHYPFHFRYPEEYRVFQPDLDRNKHFVVSKKNKQKIINSYNNSILYNDFILSEIIQILKSEGAVSMMIYCSDHGENLFDGTKHAFGRGYGKMLPSLFHVPLFVWFSEEFLNYNPSLLNTIKPNFQLYFPTANITESFTGLCGFELDTVQLRKNIFCKEYRIEEHYILNQSNVKVFYPFEF